MERDSAGMEDRSATLPYLTTTSGIGGRLKTVPEDFFVEEIPLYEFSGQGEFAYLFVEKREVSTPDLVQHIARSLGIQADTIGTAGRKDAQAVTRQFVSVPYHALESSEQIESDRIRVLETHRHGNKLRIGHLKGNRFRLVLRDVEEGSLETALKTAEQIGRLGFANFFGDQRFGARNQTDADGLKLLRGERLRRLGKDQMRFALSAVQSRLFNRWAAQRIAAGLAHRVLKGDVMQVVETGGCFVVEDSAVEQQRFDDRQIITTGPVFGPKMKHPTDEPLQHELRVLAEFGLSAEAFRKFKRLTSGTRRPLLIRPASLTIEPATDGLEFQFALPKGVYATMLLREFQKPDHESAL